MKTQTMHLFKPLLFVIIAVALFNCKGKQGDPGPTGAAGPSLSGTITGILSLTTSNGTPPSNLSGVIVTNNKGASDTTTATGAWSLPEVTGIYTLTFTKAGYGTTKVYGSGFSGGGTSYLNTVALSQPPTFTVNFATPTALDTLGGNSTATKDLHISANLTIANAPTQDVEVFIYYSTNSGVDTANYMGLTAITGQATYTATITGAELLAAQIESGEIVYMVAYPSATTTTLSSKYVNESTGKTVYTALGAPSAPVVSMKVPQ